MWSIFRIIKTNYKKSFNFKERQNRFDYWIFVLFIILITYVVMYLSNNKIINDNLSFLLLINLIPFLSSSARRLHDAEKRDKKTEQLVPLAIYTFANERISSLDAVPKILISLFEVMKIWRPQIFRGQSFTNTIQGENLHACQI